MKIVFSYIPIRLKDITELYLEYSIKNLNKNQIKPTIYSDIDYFKNKGLEYDWVCFDVEERYKLNILWSYYKLEILSQINEPFIHFDNDFLIKDISKIKDSIINNTLNLCHNHKINEKDITYYIEILNKFKNNNVKVIEKLNNTCLIGTNKFELINLACRNVIESIQENLEFFSKKYFNIPPITLNQQYFNNYFDNINYIFKSNPEYSEFNDNGVCHLSDKPHIKEITKVDKLL